MEPPKVRDVIAGEERFAPDADAVWAEVCARSHDRRITRRRFVIGGVAAGVAAVTVGTTVVARSGHTALPGPSPTVSPTFTSRSEPSPTTLATTPSTAAVTSAASASALARGRWSRLPPAPIAARQSPATAWTGTEMVVWGGIDDSASVSDGAAYDPVRRTWRTLPPAPAGAHPQWAAVWTGTSMILWGASNDGQSRRPTGARYTPGTDDWQMLPDSPLPTSAATQSVWTGSVMVALAIPGGNEPQHIEAAAYDPVADRWSSLPRVELAPGHPVLEVQAASADGTVYLWSRWQHQTTVWAGGGIMVTTSAGTDCFVLEGTAWRPVSFAGPTRPVGSQPIWTGKYFVQPASREWLGVASGPMPFNLTGRLLYPQTGKVTAIAHGPVDDLGAQSVWTGVALLSFNSRTLIAGGAVTHYPGEAAAWEPDRDEWTPLSRPGLASDGDPAAVWTGDRLLLWGRLYDPTSVGASVPRSFAGGLEFTAAR